ncbi:hypothetical protein KEM52_002766 [Ascosphaera acerosa]|nr:hypothetical protein KEM52_002766 [Ascosphaera acerosa]
MKENPPLFREYHSAPSGLRAVMDNQFRNVKTNARLQSKAMWYEWRMKLLSGLQEGLNKHEQDLQHDENVIATKEASVNESLPQLLERHGKLEADVQAMRDRVKHLSSTNRDEMRVYHTKLMQTDGRLAHTTEELNKTQAQLDEMTEALSSAAEMKTELLRETRESERVLAARRACGLTEMRQLRVTVRELENSTGWQVTGAADDSDPSSGPRLMMCYRGELTVTFDPNAVNTDATKQAAWIKLAYSPRRPGSARGPARSAIAKVLMCTAIQDLVVAGLAAHGPRDLLRGIARSWDRAVRLDSEIQHLRFCGITRARTINDQQVVIRCSLALAQASSASSRTDIDFGVTTILVSDTEVDFVVRVSAVAVYGADDRIAQRVASELGKTVGGPFTQSAGDTTSRMSWKEALASCESRLLRRAV